MAAHMKKVALVVALIAIVFPAVSPVGAVGVEPQERIAAPNTPSRESKATSGAVADDGTFCIE
jgi:hypothetical protein